jgi:hypothetical protein
LNGFINSIWENFLKRIQISLSLPTEKSQYEV